MTEIPAGSIWYDERGVGIEVYQADGGEVKGLILDAPDPLSDLVGDEFNSSRSRFLSQYEKQADRDTEFIEEGPL